MSIQAVRQVLRYQRQETIERRERLKRLGSSVLNVPIVTHPLFVPTPPEKPEKPIRDVISVSSDPSMKIEDNSAFAVAARMSPYKRKTEINRLIANIANLHSVKVDEIMSVRRSRAIVNARHAAIYEVYKSFPEMSSPQIGAVFGVDHTSVLHAVRRVERMRQEIMKCQN